jgi:CheY-like chemotaxis protein
MAKTLLLADGSVTIQRVVELTFAHEDIRVVAVSDGPRTVKWLEGDRPDIVLVDVDLPEMDGYAVVQHMKKSPRLRHTPVLLLAGAFEPVDQEKARAVGCDGIVVKPFEPAHVVTRVKELLADAVGVGAPVGVGASVGAQPKRDTPNYTGPANSPSLAILRAGTSSGTEQAEATVSKLDSVSSRQEPGTIAGTAFLRAAPGEGGQGPAPERLELPTRPVWDGAGHGSAYTPQTIHSAPPQPAAPAKVSLASAFSALLAAEQSHPAPPPPPAAAVPVAISDASVEEAVRRVLVRMTDDLVRRIVVDTAERMIREEIEKIKANPG